MNFFVLIIIVIVVVIAVVFYACDSTSGSFDMIAANGVLG
jgi:hypothetical protein